MDWLFVECHLPTMVDSSRFRPQYLDSPIGDHCSQGFVVHERICYLCHWFVTNYQSPIVNYQSPITDHQSPITHKAIATTTQLLLLIPMRIFLFRLFLLLRPVISPLSSHSSFLKSLLLSTDSCLIFVFIKTRFYLLGIVSSSKSTSCVYCRPKTTTTIWGCICCIYMGNGTIHNMEGVRVFVCVCVCKLGWLDDIEARSMYVVHAKSWSPRMG